MSPFYSEAEIDELTGIKRGTGGKNKYQMQCDFLKDTGIPFIENARGRAIVARSAIEGRSKKQETESQPAHKGWEPKLISA
ncbi:MAG: DUF4224 domain-containing protein [Limnobacter sp.]|nr:DUF4224 domain-containing protein [Limnobacter sp.]